MAITRFPDGTVIKTGPDAEPDGIPQVTRHDNGTITVGITDGTAHATITAGPGATPALLRRAFNAARAELMPGHWKWDDNA